MRVRDPVCETVIVWDQAAAVVRYHGRLHYFCQKSCRIKLIRDPRRYLGAEKSPHCPDCELGGHFGLRNPKE